jgi:acyl-CoA thioester hydrolase
MHTSIFRIYYEDTDAGGIVYYANYLKFAERARTEWLREKGFEQEKLRTKNNIAIVVRRCECEFIAPAKLDDEIVIETHLQEVGKVRMTMLQVIKRAEKTLVTLNVELACIDSSGKPVRWPKEMTDTFV